MATAPDTRRLKLPICYFVDCDDLPVWRMEGANGYVVGYLCDEHKRTDYDTRKTHKTTIHPIVEEGEEYALGPESAGSRSHSRGDAPGTATPGAGLETRRDRRVGVEGGGEDRSLVPASQSQGAGDSEGRQVSLLTRLAAAVSPTALGQPGALSLNAEEQAALMMPVDSGAVEIRPDGIVYTPWSVVASRFDAALGVGEWALVPEGMPMLQDGFVCWGFHLLLHGRWASFAIGEHPDPGRRKLSLANRAEAAKSDALVKCSKALGVFRELWDEGWRQEWKRALAIRVWAKQSEWSQRYEWLWRRKDRDPFFAEGKPGRAPESEYDRGRRFEDDARDHIEAIQAEDR